MTDPRIAVLAEALEPLLPQHTEGRGGYPHQSSDTSWTVYDWMTPDALAAAILAALPPDWCGHGAYEAEMERLWALDRAEIARLRWIEEAAREAIDALGFWDDGDATRVSYPVDRDGCSDAESDRPFVALRVVLEASE